MAQHQVLGLYRRLLRQVDKTYRVDAEQSPAPFWKNQLRNQFELPLKGTMTLDTRLLTGENALEYYQGRHTYEDINGRQNPMSNLSEHERSELTAAHVGLRLPLGFGERKGDEGLDVEHQRAYEESKKE